MDFGVCSLKRRESRRLGLENSAQAASLCSVVLTPEVNAKGECLIQCRITTLQSVTKNFCTVITSSRLALFFAVFDCQFLQIAVNVHIKVVFTARRSTRNKQSAVSVCCSV